MAPSYFADSVRTFWHAMTSNDRHASHDSPYRTGRHVPLPQGNHAPLTSVASAMDSRQDLSSAYPPEEPAPSNGFIGSPKAPLSPRRPYSPGMRSILSRQSSDNEPPPEIQMQNFNDGLPPPPPVGHAWKRIDRWAEDRYEELYDNLCEGCTQNDVNELEHELDCTLPMDVRDSLQVHDGQERGGLPTGIIFGCMLLDCEEIVMEWKNWRKVSDEFLSQRAAAASVTSPQLPSKAFAGSAASSSAAAASPTRAAQANPLWRQELQARQDSQPPNAIQKAYSHPAWIPLARDWGGNYLAVDLAPGPAGLWGQIIIYGRDYDCKYVVAKSWAAFLSAFADDLSSDKVHIDEDSGELKLRQFKQQGVEPPYLEILRWRCDQKYGRRAPRQRQHPPSANGATSPGGPLRIDPNAIPRRPPPQDGSLISPYASPAEERGRSPHRFAPPSSKGIASPSPRAHVSSPLARVAEEGPPPLRVHTDVASAPGTRGSSQVEKLVSVDTPRPSADLLGGGAASGEGNKENVSAAGVGGKGAQGELKTVKI